MHGQACWLACGAHRSRVFRCGDEHANSFLGWRNAMKLYYAAGACSLSPHIVALEAGIPLQLEKVDNKTKRTAHDEDFLQINPKGYVPALLLDNGELLTEGPAI